MTEEFLENDYDIPTPRKVVREVQSKATSQRAELQERCLKFLNYKQPKVFGIRTAHLTVDDLEYMLSASRAWLKNGPALFWKMLRESTPK